MSIFYGLHAAHPKYFSNYLLLSFSQTASLRLKTEILQLSPKLFAWINFSLYKLQAELYFHFANMTIYFFFLVWKTKSLTQTAVSCHFCPLHFFSFHTFFTNSLHSQNLSFFLFSQELWTSCCLCINHFPPVTFCFS